MDTNEDGDFTFTSEDAEIIANDVLPNLSDSSQFYSAVLSIARDFSLGKFLSYKNIKDDKVKKDTHNLMMNLSEINVENGEGK